MACWTHKLHDVREFVQMFVPISFRNQIFKSQDHREHIHPVRNKRKECLLDCSKLMHNVRKYNFKRLNQPLNWKAEGVV